MQKSLQFHAVYGMIPITLLGTRRKGYRLYIMEQIILEIINRFGYLGIGLLIAIENIFPPIPSEIILSFGGFLTTYSALHMWGVIISATIGAVAGAMLLYLIGRLLSAERLTRFLASRLGRLLRLKKEDIQKAESWFTRHGSKAVFFCRFVPIVRSLISVPAGTSKMKLRTFLPLTVIGTFIWNVALVFLGRAAGDTWETVAGYFDTYSTIALVVLLLIAGVIGILFLKKRFLNSERETKVTEKKERHLQMQTDTFRLENGAEIPCIGFGTWKLPNDDSGVAAVRAALEAGYRHIDTAAIYGNEESVGIAVRESGIPRKELFLTSKLWNDVRGYDETLAAFNESLEKLQTDYLDLYLIHWPNPKAFRENWQQANAESWRAMEQLYAEGKIRAIGVSNFLPHHLDALLQGTTVKPQVNQIRLCPGETQQETVQWCRANGVFVEAYSPMGSGKIFGNKTMQKLAANYERSVAQLCIRWCLQNEFLPLPKSVTPERILENLGVFDFTISEKDMQTIAELKGSCGEGKDPDNIDR